MPRVFPRDLAHLVLSQQSQSYVQSRPPSSPTSINIPQFLVFLFLLISILSTTIVAPTIFDAGQQCRPGLTCRDPLNRPGVLPQNYYQCLATPTFPPQIELETPSRYSICVPSLSHQPLLSATTWMYGQEFQHHFALPDPLGEVVIPSGPVLSSRIKLAFSRPLLSPRLEARNFIIDIDTLPQSGQIAIKEITFTVSAPHDKLVTQAVLSWFDPTLGHRIRVYPGLGFRSEQAPATWRQLTSQLYKQLLTPTYRYSQVPPPLLNPIRAYVVPDGSIFQHQLLTSCDGFQFLSRAATCPTSVWGQDTCRSAIEGIVVDQRFSFQESHVIGLGSYGRFAFRYISNSPAKCGIIPTMTRGTVQENWTTVIDCPASFLFQQPDKEIPLAMIELPHVSKMYLFGHDSTDWPLLAPGQKSTDALTTARGQSLPPDPLRTLTMKMIIGDRIFYGQELAVQSDCDVWGLGCSPSGTKHCPIVDPPSFFVNPQPPPNPSTISINSANSHVYRFFRCQCKDETWDKIEEYIETVYNEEFSQFLPPNENHWSTYQCNDLSRPIRRGRSFIDGNTSLYAPQLLMMNTTQILFENDPDFNTTPDPNLIPLPFPTTTTQYDLNLSLGLLTADYQYIGHGTQQTSEYGTGVIIGTMSSDWWALHSPSHVLSDPDILNNPASAALVMIPNVKNYIRPLWRQDQIYISHLDPDFSRAVLLPWTWDSDFQRSLSPDAFPDRTQFDTNGHRIENTGDHSYNPMSPGYNPGPTAQNMIPHGEYYGWDQKDRLFHTKLSTFQFYTVVDLTQGCKFDFHGSDCSFKISIPQLPPLATFWAIGDTLNFEISYVGVSTPPKLVCHFGADLTQTYSLFDDDYYNPLTHTSITTVRHVQIELTLDLWLEQHLQNEPNGSSHLLNFVCKETHRHYGDEYAGSGEFNFEAPLATVKKDCFTLCNAPYTESCSFTYTGSVNEPTLICNCFSDLSHVTLDERCSFLFFRDPRLGILSPTFAPADFTTQSPSTLVQPNRSLSYTYGDMFHFTMSLSRFDGVGGVEWADLIGFALYLTDISSTPGPSLIPTTPIIVPLINTAFDQVLFYNSEPSSRPQFTQFAVQLTSDLIPAGIYRIQLVMIDTSVTTPPTTTPQIISTLPTWGMQNKFTLSIYSDRFIISPTYTWPNLPQQSNSNLQTLSSLQLSAPTYHPPSNRTISPALTPFAPATTTTPTISADPTNPNILRLSWTAPARIPDAPTVYYRIGVIVNDGCLHSLSGSYFLLDSQIPSDRMPDLPPVANGGEVFHHLKRDLIGPDLTPYTSTTSNNSGWWITNQVYFPETVLFVDVDVTNVIYPLTTSSGICIEPITLNLYHTEHHPPKSLERWLGLGYAIPQDQNPEVSSEIPTFSSNSVFSDQFNTKLDQILLNAAPVDSGYPLSALPPITITQFFPVSNFLRENYYNNDPQSQPPTVFNDFFGGSIHIMIPSSINHCLNGGSYSGIDQPCLCPVGWYGFFCHLPQPIPTIPFASDYSILSIETGTDLGHSFVEPGQLQQHEHKLIRLGQQSSGHNSQPINPKMFPTTTIQTTSTTCPIQCPTPMEADTACTQCTCTTEYCRLTTRVIYLEGTPRSNPTLSPTAIQTFPQIFAATDPSILLTSQLTPLAKMMSYLPLDGELLATFTMILGLDTAPGSTQFSPLSRTPIFPTVQGFGPWLRTGQIGIETLSAHPYDTTPSSQDDSIAALFFVVIHPFSTFSDLTVLANREKLNSRFAQMQSSLLSYIKSTEPLPLNAIVSQIPPVNNYHNTLFGPLSIFGNPTGDSTSLFSMFSLPTTTQLLQLPESSAQLLSTICVIPPPPLSNGSSNPSLTSPTQCPLPSFESITTSPFWSVCDPITFTSFILPQCFISATPQPSLINITTPPIFTSRQIFNPSVCRSTFPHYPQNTVAPCGYSGVNQTSTIVLTPPIFVSDTVRNGDEVEVTWSYSGIMSFSIILSLHIQYPIDSSFRIKEASSLLSMPSDDSDKIYGEGTQAYNWGQFTNLYNHPSTSYDSDPALVQLSYPITYPIAILSTHVPRFKFKIPTNIAEIISGNPRTELYSTISISTSHVESLTVNAPEPFVIYSTNLNLCESLQPDCSTIPNTLCAPSSGQCECQAPYYHITDPRFLHGITETDKNPPYCTIPCLHGTFNPVTIQCKCDQGWDGYNCNTAIPTTCRQNTLLTSQFESKAVSSKCTSHGFHPKFPTGSPKDKDCDEAKCTCLNFFSGDQCQDCALQTDNVCNLIGTNWNKTVATCSSCHCRYGYFGSRCQTKGLLMALNFARPPHVSVGTALTNATELKVSYHEWLLKYADGNPNTRIHEILNPSSNSDSEQPSTVSGTQINVANSTAEIQYLKLHDDVNQYIIPSPHYDPSFDNLIKHDLSISLGIDASTIEILTSFATIQTDLLWTVQNYSPSKSKTQGYDIYKTPSTTHTPMTSDYISWGNQDDHDDLDSGPFFSTATLANENYYLDFDTIWQYQRPSVKTTVLIAIKVEDDEDGETIIPESHHQQNLANPRYYQLDPHDNKHIVRSEETLTTTSTNTSSSQLHTLQSTSSTSETITSNIIFGLQSVPYPVINSQSLQVLWTQLLLSYQTKFINRLPLQFQIGTLHSLSQPYDPGCTFGTSTEKPEETNSIQVPRCSGAYPITDPLSLLIPVLDIPVEGPDDPTPSNFNWMALMVFMIGLGGVVVFFCLLIIILYCQSYKTFAMSVIAKGHCDDYRQISPLRNPDSLFSALAHRWPFSHFPLINSFHLGSIKPHLWYLFTTKKADYDPFNEYLVYQRMIHIPPKPIEPLTAENAPLERTAPAYVYVVTSGFRLNDPDRRTKLKREVKFMGEGLDIFFDFQTLTNVLPPLVYLPKLRNIPIREVEILPPYKVTGKAHNMPHTRPLKSLLRPILKKNLSTALISCSGGPGTDFKANSEAVGLNNNPDTIGTILEIQETLADVDSSAPITSPLDDDQYFDRIVTLEITDPDLCVVGGLPPVVPWELAFGGALIKTYTRIPTRHRPKRRRQLPKATHDHSSHPNQLTHYYKKRESHRTDSILQNYPTLSHTDEERHFDHLLAQLKAYRTKIRTKKAEKIKLMQVKIIRIIFYLLRKKARGKLKWRKKNKKQRGTQIIKYQQSPSRIPFFSDRSYYYCARCGVKYSSLEGKTGHNKECSKIGHYNYYKCRVDKRDDSMYIPYYDASEFKTIRDSVESKPFDVSSLVRAWELRSSAANQKNNNAANSDTTDTDPAPVTPPLCNSDTTDAAPVTPPLCNSDTTDAAPDGSSETAPAAVPDVSSETAPDGSNETSPDGSKDATSPANRDCGDATPPDNNNSGDAKPINPQTLKNTRWKRVHPQNPFIAPRGQRREFFLKREADLEELMELGLDQTLDDFPHQPDIQKSESRLDFEFKQSQLQAQHPLHIHKNLTTSRHISKLDQARDFFSNERYFSYQNYVHEQSLHINYPWVDCPSAVENILHSVWLQTLISRIQSAATLTLGNLSHLLSPFSDDNIPTNPLTRRDLASIFPTLKTSTSPSTATTALDTDWDQPPILAQSETRTTAVPTHQELRQHRQPSLILHPFFAFATNKIYREALLSHLCYGSIPLTPLPELQPIKRSTKTLSHPALEILLKRILDRTLKNSPEAQPPAPTAPGSGAINNATTTTKDTNTTTNDAIINNTASKTTNDAIINDSTNKTTNDSGAVTGDSNATTKNTSETTNDISATTKNTSETTNNDAGTTTTMNPTARILEQMYSETQSSSSPPLSGAELYQINELYPPSRLFHLFLIRLYRHPTLSNRNIYPKTLPDPTPCIAPPNQPRPHVELSPLDFIPYCMQQVAILNSKLSALQMIRPLTGLKAHSLNPVFSNFVDTLSGKGWLSSLLSSDTFETQPLNALQNQLWAIQRHLCQIDNDYYKDIELEKSTPNFYPKRRGYCFMEIEPQREPWTPKEKEMLQKFRLARRHREIDELYSDQRNLYLIRLNNGDISLKEHADRQQRYITLLETNLKQLQEKLRQFYQKQANLAQNLFLLTQRTRRTNITLSRLTTSHQVIQRRLQTQIEGVKFQISNSNVNIERAKGQLDQINEQIKDKDGKDTNNNTSTTGNNDLNDNKNNNTNDANDTNNSDTTDGNAINCDEQPQPRSLANDPLENDIEFETLPGLVAMISRSETDNDDYSGDDYDDYLDGDYYDYLTDGDYDDYLAGDYDDHHDDDSNANDDYDDNDDNNNNNNKENVGNDQGYDGDDDRHSSILYHRDYDVDSDNDGV